MTAPRLLDLFCGAGGASMGYAWSGFDVLGVDIIDHDDYPLDFIRADALDVLADSRFVAQFDVIHASPPCPRWSSVTPAQPRAGYPDLLKPTRDALNALHKPYVIENVPGAPLIMPLMLCGASFGLGTVCADGKFRHLRRHRLFETNMPLMGPGCCCPSGEALGVYGGGSMSALNRDQATGRAARGYMGNLAEKRKAMGIHWIKRRSDLNDAIPPAYTEYLGWQLLSLAALVP